MGEPNTHSKTRISIKYANHHNKIGTTGFVAKRNNTSNNKYSSRGGRQRQQSQQRGYTQRQQTDQNKQCFKCGNPFGPGHLQQCPAKDKICNKCTKRGHYARLCKSSEVNDIQEEQVADQIPHDTDVAAYVNYMQAGDLIRFESKSVNQIDESDLKGHLVRIRCGHNDIVFIADTGSPPSFINQRTANLIVSTVKSAKRLQTTKTDEANRMVCYNGYKIPSFGRLITSIESGGWTLNTTSLIVVDDKRANILGRNILPQIGIQLQ